MTCYLVRHGYFVVFSIADPRADGCDQPVADDVWLDSAGLTDPATGGLPAGLCVGRHPTAANRYRLFRSPADRSRAGFHQVVGVPVVVPTWGAFLRAAADCGEPVG